MKFGEVPLAEAEGCILAHSFRGEKTTLAKGRILTALDIAALKEERVPTVICARLEKGDIPENDAAEKISAGFGKYENMYCDRAAKGRVNILSRANGLFRVSPALIDEVNRIDPSVTFATLADYARVSTGDMVATLKIIPLAVHEKSVEKARSLFAGCSAFAVRPFLKKRVGVVHTWLPFLKPATIAKTRKALERRLSASASMIEADVTVEHAAANVAEALKNMGDFDLIIVFGASAVVDADDVVPAGIKRAGGTVDRVGMPVDPGNLLVLGKLGRADIIVAPGCARTPVENGFDWILDRILAGERPTGRDITAMGVGGLLKEIAARPSLRREAGSENDTAVSIVLLAAGTSSRMENAGHKLLSRFGGVPLARRMADAACASGADAVVVVLGHRADEIAGTLSGLPALIVRNDSHAEGMASSLRSGLAEVKDKSQGILVMLADMPGITTQMLDSLIEAFRASGGTVIVRAVSGGKKGNPVILPRSMFESIARLEGDTGARRLIETSGLDVVEVDIGAGALLDVDTLEALCQAGGLPERDGM